ncbi:thioredoxin domain-containing protein [uncultured Microbacterium sp.]|uniref:DsbA family protein n=1 Tax=uncultured Microbacterium sp. TaxID=191216 RepID=UPI0026181160|nr:thioredoxin domain-containing protein [uncultured Microbacterium sp.]
MSSDDNSSAPASRSSREAVREKALQVQAQQSRARVLRRSALIAGLVAAVAVVAVVVMWAIGSTAGRPQLSPANTTADGFVITDVSGLAPAQAEMTDPGAATPDATTEGEANPTPTATDAPAVVDIQVYVDYLSPGAREWQLANSAQLASWVGEGAVALRYHPVSMMTAKSNGTKYSLRAAGAAACVANYEPATFFKFHTALLTQQPEVDSDGISDDKLADLAIASGAEDPKQIRACVQDGAFTTWVKSATERAVGGISGTNLALTGTPMVIVNGQQYVGDLTDAAEFAQFVLTSASGAYQKSQTATPTATPSPTP